MSASSNNFNGDFNALSADDLVSMLAEMRGQIAEMREIYKVTHAQHQILSEEEGVLHKAWREKQQEWQESGKKLKKIQEDGKAHENRIEELERYLARQRLLEAEKNHFIEWSKQIDINTAGLKWREFAYDHQIIGAKKLAFAKSGILGDGIGLGKTLTSLVWADMLNAKKVIVIAPKEILKNFQKEIIRWSPNRNIIDLIGKNKVQRDVMLNVLKMATNTNFIITLNLEAWRKDNELIQDLIDIQFDAIIVDEAHKLKNAKSVAFKGVKELRYANNKCPMCKSNKAAQRSELHPTEGSYKKYFYCKECEFGSFDYKDFMSVKHYLGMTGTLILNKANEFWANAFLVNKEVFPSERYFLEDYCYQAAPNKWRFRKNGLVAISEKIGPSLVVRDRKDAGIVVPPQEVKYYEVPFNAVDYPKQFQAYKELEQFAAIRLESDEVMSMPAYIALLTRFRQMITWPGAIGIKDDHGNIEFRCEVKESVKLDKAEEIIKELVNAGERVIVFSQFKDTLRELHRRLDHCPYEDEDDEESFMTSIVMEGETKDEIREIIQKDFDIKTFKEDPDYEYKYDILLANYRVGGTGLNFNAATQMVIIDEEWNPGMQAQAFGRIDRIGQTRETTVHVLRAVSDELGFNIDLFMANILEDKTKLVGEFDSSAKAVSGRMLDMLRRDIEGS